MSDFHRFSPAGPRYLDTARCSIIPPYLLQRLAATDLPAAGPAQRTLQVDDARRQARSRYLTGGGSATDSRPGASDRRAEADRQVGPQRRISDAQGREELPGVPVRVEGDPAVDDEAANEAYDGLGATFELFWGEYGRNSLDGKGLQLMATVHFGQRFDNAFWDGEQMVFGDGDGEIFQRFTRSLDVIGHELAHGVIEHTAGLMYRNQSGALNESVADVFGVLVVQRHLGQTADQADWLIGADLLTERVNGRALRSMLEPGTAYDDPALGKDPQPAHLRDLVVTSADNGGVHINSGIPNRAFALAALQLGGAAWERAGQVWYDTLAGPGIKADCDFSTFAELTVLHAGERFGASSAEAAAIRDGWRQVGVLDGAGGGRGSDRPDEPSSHQTQGQSDDPADPSEPGEQIPSAEVHVQRTGGFAGLTRQGTVQLDELPQPTARAWMTLLHDPMIRHQPASTQLRDGFTYHLHCEAFGLRTTLSQDQTTPGQRRLLDDSLE